MRPWLMIPPKWAHDLSSLALPVISFLHEKDIPEWHSFSWRGLHFSNPLGIAGGVDKNADNIGDWWRLGCGFVEVGTVTPRPQDPNPGIIMDRDLQLQAMWNKMGFPSEGAEEVYFNLKTYGPEFKTPIFVNIGKNRTTANADAVYDYLFLMDRFKDLADVFVVNISSPNTKGLRDLQKKENLQALLNPLVDRAAQNNGTPLLVKLSPDMGEEGLAEAISNCADIGVDGLVLTNTTLTRPQGCHFSEEGGLSGAPLKDLSKKALEIAAKTLGNKKKDMLIVSAGGIMTPQDVFERLQMGANLVQIYSALVFYGPGFFHEVSRRYHEEKQ